jgi:XTP/dITP diphosphohydrolase
MTNTVVLASGNEGKLRELRELLRPLSLTLVTQTSLGIHDADETGLTFIENAIIKARHACAASGLPALADDSGLVVDALNGAPGIYSARYADTADDADRLTRDNANNQKLLDALASVPNAQRSAHFHCVLVLMRHAADHTPLVCHGKWSGTILHAPAGTGGFGYDPLFLVPEMNCSSAQLSPEQKNQLSHRAQALKLLLQQLKLP